MVICQLQLITFFVIAIGQLEHNVVGYGSCWTSHGTGKLIDNVSTNHLLRARWQPVPLEQGAAMGLPLSRS